MKLCRYFFMHGLSQYYNWIDPFRHASRNSNMTQSNIYPLPWETLVQQDGCAVLIGYPVDRWPPLTQSTLPWALILLANEVAKMRWFDESHPSLLLGLWHVAQKYFFRFYMVFTSTITWPLSYKRPYLQALRFFCYWHVAKHFCLSFQFSIRWPA